MATFRNGMQRMGSPWGTQQNFNGGGNAFLRRRSMGAIDLSDQVAVCAAAASAVARGDSLAAPGLVARCNDLRRANVMAGRFIQDAYPVDGSLRTALTSAGEAIIVGSPTLASALAAQPQARQRGFKMGVAVRRGTATPGYRVFLKPGLDPETSAGFDAGMATASPSANGFDQAGGSDEGIPRAALIAGGAVAVVGLGLLAWKFLG